MIDNIRYYWNEGIRSYSKIANITKINKKFVKRITARFNKHGMNLVNKRGPRSKINKEMLDYV